MGVGMRVGRLRKCKEKLPIILKTVKIQRLNIFAKSLVKMNVLRFLFKQYVYLNYELRKEF